MVRVFCPSTLLSTLVVLSLLVQASPSAQPDSDVPISVSPAQLHAHRRSFGNLNHHRSPVELHPRLASNLNRRRSCKPPVSHPAAANGTAVDNSNNSGNSGNSDNSGASCFPSLGFNMPSSTPSSTDNWWCSPDTEYAFLGFSYEVTACQSPSQLHKEFQDIRTRFNGRYVRLYGACDRKGFYDDVVNAAWDNSLGVHALIWFGFNGGNIWETRRDTLFASLHSNPKAKFVTRVVQFGSEPLFDHVLPPAQLASQVQQAKAKLASLGIPVTVSDMAYGFQSNGGAQDVLDAMDQVNAHILPFFAGKASSAKNSWPLVISDINWFFAHTKGKKVYLDENGWPSKSYAGVQANSASAVANVQNEQDYFDLLDSKCSDFKKMPEGGVGWFAHIYSESQEPGYGVLDGNGKLKFPFHPRTSC